jgi:hypothetical protein
MTTGYSAKFAESVVTWSDLIEKVMNPRDGVYQRLLRLQDLVHQFLSSIPKPSKTPTGVETSTFEMPQGVPDNDPAFVSLLQRNASVLDETTPVSRNRDVGGKKVRRTGDGEIDNDEFPNADDEDLDVGAPCGDDLAASEFEMMESFLATNKIDGIDISVYEEDPFQFYRDIQSADKMGYDSTRSDWDKKDMPIIDRLHRCFSPNLNEPSDFPRFNTELQRFYRTLLEFRSENDAGLKELSGMGFRRKRAVTKKVVRGGSLVKL